MEPGSFAGALVRLFGPIGQLFDNPLRIVVVEGAQRWDVLAEARAAPRIVPFFAPGDLPDPASFDVRRPYPNIDDTARAQGWTPVERDRFVLRLYNKSSDAVSILSITAEAKGVAPKLPDGHILHVSAGGNYLKTFGIQVVLRTTEEGSTVEANLPVGDGKAITSSSFELSPRESVHLIVDADIAIDDPAPAIDWRLRFIVDAHRGVRALRTAHAPTRFANRGHRGRFRVLRRGRRPVYWTESDNSRLFRWREEA